MKNPRLTNELRRKIRKAVLEHRFASDEAALKETEDSIGKAVYDELYPDGSPARDRLFSSPVDGEYCWTNEVHCVFKGNHGSKTFLLPESRPFLHKHVRVYENSAYVEIGPDGHIAVLRQKYKDRKDSLDEARKDAGSLVWAVLEKATTIKKLVEIWPEIEPFIPQDVTAPVVNLPAVPTEEINALLGLKKE